MLAGCFFYSAPTFARSIKCVRLCLERRLHDNEETSALDYDSLTIVVKNLRIGGLFTDQQQDDVAGEIFELLLSQRVVELNRDDNNNNNDEEERPQFFLVLPPLKKSKGCASVFEGGKSLHGFLSACYKFLDEHSSS